MAKRSAAATDEAPQAHYASASTRAWPADHVERWPLDRITQNARNARTHSDAQIAQLVRSFLEWGWTNPLLVDESGTLIAGHGRYVAALEAGYTDAPVMVARGWTDAQKRAYMLADNKLALNAGWNDELLSLELTDLQAMGFDLLPIGFSDAEIADALMGHDFKPGDAAGQGTLDTKQPIVCPSCGHEFTR